LRTPIRAYLGLVFLGLAAMAMVVGARAADTKDGIGWLSYREGRAKALESGQRLLINFTADWCVYCRKMKSETYTDPAVIAYLQEHFVPVMVDTQREQRIAAEFYVRGLPTIWFLASDGQRITNLPGYVDAPMFLKVLRYIASGSYEQMDFKTFLDAEEPPTDGDADG
jgi:thioredoxin-related protein